MAISGKLLLLRLNEALRSQGSGGSVHDLFRLDQNNKLQLLKLPQVDSDAASGNDLIRKSQYDAGIYALDGRVDTAESKLNVLQGADSIPGSVAKAEKDSKAYTDQKISSLIGSSPELLNTLQELAEALDNDPEFAANIAQSLGELDSRLDIVQGGAGVTGSIIHAVEGERARAESAEQVLDERLDVLQAGNGIPGSVDYKVKAERDRAEAIEQGLDSRLDDVEEDIQSLASNDVITGLDSRIDSLEVDMPLKASQAALQSEVTRAQAAEQSLDGRLDIIQGSDSTSGSIAYAVKVEKDRAELAEGALEDRLDIVQGADSVEGSFAKAVKAEKDRAELVENGHEDRLDLLQDSDSVLGSVAYSVKQERLRAEGVEALKANSSDVSTSLSGKADLVGGKIPQAQIPAIAIVDTFEASSQAEMLALSSAEQGDVCIRSDVNKTFILASGSYATLANWKELKTPTDTVLSVNGQIGAVSLSKSDVDLGNVDNTSDANKPISTATQTALNLKADQSGVTTSLAGKASTTLNNLGSTSINADLMPSASITRSVGSSGLQWLIGFFQTIRANTIESISSGLSIKTSDSVSAATSSVTVTSGSVTGASSSNSGVAAIQTGSTAGSGSSGPVLVKSGPALGSGSSGSVTIGTGTSSGGVRGAVIFDANEIRPNSAGSGLIGTLNFPFGAFTGALVSVRNNTTFFGSLGSSVSIDGNASLGLASAGNKALYLASQSSVAGQASTKVVMTSGDAVANFNSGDVQIKSGAVSGSGVRGKILFDAAYVDANSSKISNLAEPSASSDAATKSFSEAKRDEAKSYADAEILTEKNRAIAAENLLDGRLDTVEALKVQEQAYQKVTLTSADLSSVSVSYEIKGTPWVMREGVMGRPGTDFTFSGSTITFAGEWINPNGTSAVEVGDEIFVFYMKEVNLM